QVSGRIPHCDKIGRTITVPTANLVLRHLHTPIRGVYAVTVSGAGVCDHPAVASIGTRPTVGGTQWRLEVHLLHYQGDLYGKHLTVTLQHYLRPELKFDELEQLKQAIDTDIQQATQWFSAKGLMS